MKKENTSRPLVIFLGITFALSIFLSIVVGATGGAKSNLAGLGLTAMLFPGPAVLINTTFSIKYQSKRNLARVTLIKKLLNGEYIPTGIEMSFMDKKSYKSINWIQLPVVFL